MNHSIINLGVTMAVFSGILLSVLVTVYNYNPNPFDFGIARNMALVLCGGVILGTIVVVIGTQIPERPFN